MSERVTAADGKTDLYAVYFAPHGRSAGTKSTVIDAAYGGAQVIVTPRNFVEAYRGGERGKSSLARLGFGVMTVDARGTPMRSRAFRDAGYPEFTQVGIDDHIAAIRDLARRHPEIDLTRVGIYGGSAGGQDTLKGKILRLAHMGYIDQFDVLAAISGLELVLLELGHPLEPGCGLAAAQQVLAGAVRQPAVV